MRCLKEKFNLSVMIVDITTLQSPILPLDFELQPEEVNLVDESIELKSAVKVTGELKRGIVQTDIAGTIAAEVSLECSRCLKTVEQNLEMPFAAAYIAEEDYTQAKEAELNETDLDVSMFAGDKIDLTELVREQILLSVPTQILCKEDCQGLCEKCGADRNLIDCKCEETEIDQRWAALKNLK